MANVENLNPVFQAYLRGLVPELRQTAESLKAPSGLPDLRIPETIIYERRYREAAEQLAGDAEITVATRSILTDRYNRIQKRLESPEVGEDRRTLLDEYTTLHDLLALL